MPPDSTVTEVRVEIPPPPYERFAVPFWVRAPCGDSTPFSWVDHTSAKFAIYVTTNLQEKGDFSTSSSTPVWDVKLYCAAQPLGGAECHRPYCREPQRSVSGEPPGASLWQGSSGARAGTLQASPSPAICHVKKYMARGDSRLDLLPTGERWGPQPFP